MRGADLDLNLSKKPNLLIAFYLTIILINLKPFLLKSFEI